MNNKKTGSETEEKTEELCTTFQSLSVIDNLTSTADQGKAITSDHCSKEVDIGALKESKRQHIWKLMEEKDLIKPYPPSCFNKIPNFKGSGKAAEKLSKLREFQSARIIKINPSLAQMHLRFLTLRNGKTLFVPSPALGDAFMYVVDPKNLKQFWQFKRASSKAGAKEFGTELSISRDSESKIDLYVVASTVVSANGVRLGKGLGYAELEWAIFYMHGMVTKDTIVATTVHDSQVLSPTDLPISLMKCHDLPVDIIVTPTRVINVRKKLIKPSGGVHWDLVTENQLENIPILKRLKL
ncbi:methenyltetrahydrofolate synthase domain-containing protein-like [Clytia hemisphaerica]